MDNDTNVTNIATDPNSVAGNGSFIINVNDKTIIKKSSDTKTLKKGGTTTNIATGPNSAAGNNSVVINLCTDDFIKNKK